MAIISGRIGDFPGIIHYDDADHDCAIEVDAPIKSGTPVDATDVLRLEDLVGGSGNVVFSAAVIADHAVIRGDGGVREIQDSLVIINDLGSLQIHIDAVADNIEGLLIHAHAFGQNIVTGQVINYVTGALAAGEVGGGLFITLDETEAVASDDTTVIACIACTTTQVNDVTKRAIVILPGFTEALKVFGAIAEDPDFGYENTLTAVTDRVNGGAGDGNAFLEAGNDLEIFDNDDDYILIGSNNQFEVIEAILAVQSTFDIEADYFYSRAGGLWNTLPIQGDSTNGMQDSGSIVFVAPADWTKDDEDLDANAIVDAYYIAIQRTRIGVIPVLPTEDYFKTFLSLDLGMIIRGDGVIKLPYLGAAPAGLEDGMIWMENDGLHLYYNSAEKVVAGV
jgi:hypothetical protein